MYKISKQFNKPLTPRPTKQEDILSWAQVFHQWADEHVHKIHEELKAIEADRTGQISTRIVSTGIVGGGGAGGTVSKVAIYVGQDVAAAGIVTVPFADLGTSEYGIISFMMNANGVTLLIPNMPPLTDSRTRVSFTVPVYEAGRVHSFVILQ